MCRVISYIVLCIAGLSALVQPAAAGDTDAILRLRDERRRHPEISSITFPGHSVWRQTYDAIYSHGAIIENRWVALRIYMNQGHGVDAYLKQRPGLECRQTGFYTDSIGRAGGLGADVLYVGSSIGAGSFRGFDGNAAVPLDSVGSRTMAVLNDSTVMLKVEGWHFNGHDISVTETYTAHAHSSEIDVNITLQGALPADRFCTGAQKLAVDNSGGFLAGTHTVAWSRGANAPDTKRPDMLESVAISVGTPLQVATVETQLDYLLVFDASQDIHYSIQVQRP